MRPLKAVDARADKGGEEERATEEVSEKAVQKNVPDPDLDSLSLYDRPTSSPGHVNAFGQVSAEVMAVG